MDNQKILDLLEALEERLKRYDAYPIKEFDELTIEYEDSLLGEWVRWDEFKYHLEDIKNELST